MIPPSAVLIDLSRMDSVYYDRRQGAVVVEAGATIGRVYQALDMSWGVTLPGGSCTGVGMGGHVTGGGFGPLSRLHGLISDHLYAVEAVVVDENGQANALTATREEGDPHRDLWWAHSGGGGGNFGVATRFWFRSRDGEDDDPTLCLPKRPTGYTMASVAWRWADLDEEKFTTLVNNFMHWCERNSSPGGPAASVYGTLVLFRKEFGVVTLSGQVDPGHSRGSRSAGRIPCRGDNQRAERHENDTGRCAVAVQHDPCSGRSRCVGDTGYATALEGQGRLLAICIGPITGQDAVRTLEQ